MKLYHGTNMVFDSIDLKKSKPNKDFGQGFYLSDNLEQAQALAQARVESPHHQPFNNFYRLKYSN